MIENFRDHTENSQMQNLLEEAKEILENSSDLNRDRPRLGRLLDEIMHWTKEGDEQFNQYYNDFCNTITAMINLDFSRRLPEQYSKTIFSFMTLGLNILNEELFGKITSTKMLHSILGALNLKNTAVILTNATGQIVFVHSKVKNIFVAEDMLVGQPMSVIIEDFDKLDKKFKSEGFLKGIDVKIKFGNETEQVVTLKVAIPSVLSPSEGVAYLLTLSDKQVASINEFNKGAQVNAAVEEIATFENNCVKFEFTLKEREIVSLLAKGHNQKEIADKLFRSTHTIAKHLQNMFVKTGVKNRSELISVLKYSI
jgi:DNA-binding CsgD family transcriptional regulator